MRSHLPRPALAAEVTGPAAVLAAGSDRPAADRNGRCVDLDISVRSTVYL